MAKKILIRWLAESSGYCCQYAFVMKNRHKTKVDWAKEVGVSESTVQESRTQVRDGIIVCRECDGCIKHELLDED
jgi:hypothetical protein